MEKYSWFKTEWHVNFDKSIQVNGLGEGSRQAYTRAMRMLVEHCDKTPLIAEEELFDIPSLLIGITLLSPRGSLHKN